MKLHNQLYRGTWSKAIKLLLGDTKGEGGIERYGETLQPVIDMWREPWFAHPRDERLAWHNRPDAADAANLSQVGLRNPTGSQKLIWLEDALATTATQDIGVYLAGAADAIDGSSSGFPRDLRLNAPPQQSGIVGLLVDRTGVLIPTAIGPVFHLEPGPTRLDVVLPPGTTVWFTSGAINQAISMCLRWRERTAQPGEL